MAKSLADKMLSRRAFLAATSVLALSLPAHAWRNGTIYQYPSNVWMATPDILAFTVDDPPIISGNVISGEFTSHAYDTWFQMTNPATGNLEWCAPFGINRLFLKFSDKPPTASLLDKVALRTIGNYTVNGATLTAIYYRDEAIGQGLKVTASNGSGDLMITQRHTVYLKFSAPLSNFTTLTISNSAPNTFSSFQCTFNDKITRANGIQVNQLGQRPDDALRYAYLAARIPAGPNNGTVDFINEYGFSTFQILDSDKNSVFTGSIVQRVSSAATTGEGYDSGMDVADMSVGYVVTGISKAANAVVTCPGHPFVNGDKCRFAGINGMTQIDAPTLIPPSGAGIWVAPTVTVIDANSFSVNIDSTSFSTFSAGTTFSEALGGINNRVYKCFNTNRAGTFVFALDFSAWTPSTSGVHYIYIPGYGISDPFLIQSDVWAQAAAQVHQGIYSLRLGIPVSNTCGYNRGSCLVDGVDGCTNYQSTLPSFLTSETGNFNIPSGSTKIGSGLGAYVDVGTLTLSGLTASSGVVTATTTAPHGVAVGQSFAVQVLGCTPTGYNIGTGTIATSTGASTFTYRTDSGATPASPATVAGFARTGFVTSTRAAGRPGHQDAGDNDDLFIDHAPGWKLLALVFRNIPKPSRYTPFIVPLSSQVLDPTLFPAGPNSGGGTDDLPPLFHEMFWYAEAYRTTQEVDGSIWGGYGVGKFSSQVPTYPETIDRYRGTDAGGSLTGQTVMGFAYARDHYGTFLWAGLAALLAQIAYDYNLTALGDAYKASAIAAYAWADPLATNIAAYDAYYNGTLNLQTKAGWSDTTYYDVMYLLNGVASTVPAQAIQAKMDAAGSLYRLLGSAAGQTPYGDFIEKKACTTAAISSGGSGYAVNDIIITADGTGVDVSTTLLVTAVSGGAVTGVRILTQGQFTSAPANPVAQASTTGSGTGASFNLTTTAMYGVITGNIGAYDYCSTPGANAAAKAYFQTYYSTTAPSVGLNTNISYQGMMWSTAVNTGGGTSASTPLRPLQAHLNDVLISGVTPTTTASSYLKLMQAGCSFIMGANLAGKAYVTGMGPRPFKLILHEDSYRLGVAGPYGINPFGFFSWANSFMFNNFSGIGDANTDSTSQYNSDNTSGSFQSATIPGSAKMWNPWRFGSSYWEWSPENRAIIYNSEFSQGSTLGLLTMMLYLHGWDGNT